MKIRNFRIFHYFESRVSIQQWFCFEKLQTIIHLNFLTKIKLKTYYLCTVFPTLGYLKIDFIYKSSKVKIFFIMKDDETSYQVN
jgi:hypothetical protein